MQLRFFYPFSTPFGFFFFKTIYLFLSLWSKRCNFILESSFMHFSPDPNQIICTKNILIYAPQKMRLHSSLLFSKNWAAIFTNFSFILSSRVLCVGGRKQGEVQLAGSMKASSRLHSGRVYMGGWGHWAEPQLFVLPPLLLRSRRQALLRLTACSATLSWFSKPLLLYCSTVWKAFQIRPVPYSWITHKINFRAANMSSDTVSEPPTPEVKASKFNSQNIKIEL